MKEDMLLVARDVHRIFRMRQGFGRPTTEMHAVKGVSLDVPRGGVLGIVGESGCGKSTLARIIAGLDRPSSGTVKLDGRDLQDIDRPELADFVQPVFQDPYLSLNPRKSIETIISLPLRIRRRLGAAQIAAEVRRMMDLTGLPQRLATAYPSQLSGGQRQRVAIARALISSPQLLICDEPTSALDVSIQAQILNLLQELRTELKLTYVLISHNLAVVEHMASEVMVMYRGDVLERAPASELFARPRTDYTRLLLASILTPEPEKGLPDVRFLEPGTIIDRGN
ncbi:ATP-binding cassette domain-containing protein [Rhizobiaceae bacterium BDR2-2]|uniref:ATP-binding cassette domain-containing protein n=1 Tax=Ectorhizobium quercum TaxID=2965071 RepID=A0AAE3N191_9HYPH|nr:ATP-binding cassette domain-containing protein [Ectorhizobium quercum]MCX8997440.1 ATP-binding cassette domain-containing protein [Ectorhizobium quercum]